MVFARRIFGGAVFLVMCSAVAALACRDIERPVAPTGPKVGQVQQLPPVILSLTCMFGASGAAITCQQSLPPLAAGVSASVIYGTGSPGSAQYGIFYAYNLVKDTVAHTWQFTAYLQNLLKQSIGTLNGTTVTGVKVFVTDFHATSGTGTVSVANADGIGNFTAPNQPYFNYNQIVAPNGYTGNKLWKFNVPNTVTAVSMSILISTDFPAEQNVTLVPPTTIPDWVRSDTNLAAPSVNSSGSFTKHIVKVRFRPSATLADRQLAIALVNGTVVGGRRGPDGTSGYYLVQVADDGTGTGILAVAKTLTSLPQIQSAIFEISLNELYLKPIDSGDYGVWGLNPDGADITKKRWSLEAVDAPFAWGCSTGNLSAQVGVVDAGFHSIPDLTSNIEPTSAAFSFPDNDSHGTMVSSILAAAGNNGIDMTGAMWYAKVLSRNPSIDSVAHKHYPGFYPDAIGEQTASLAAAGARVVNLSWGREYQSSPGVYYVPRTKSTDSAQAAGAATDFLEGLRLQQRILASSRTPLIVIGAGNFAHTGNHAGIDAWWSGLPQIKDSLHDTVLVVGASDPHRNVAWFSGANITHQYVDIMAPGDTVYALDRLSTLTKVSGTSVSAPLVTGSAGLLIAFDPQLGDFIAGHGAPELRQLILAGADSNSRSDGTVRKAGVYRFLSLYKPLVLAAQRSGAPLCSNHVWISGTSIIAQRTPTLLDTIWSDPTFPNSLNVKHGGHRIVFVNDTGDAEIAYDAPTRKWKVSINPNDPAPATDGGVYNSTFGMSHNGDSSLVNLRSTNQSTVTINAYNRYSGLTTFLVNIPTGLVSSVDSACVRELHSNAECLVKNWIGFIEAATVRAAYSPTGGNAVVAISPIKTEGSVSTGWSACFDSPPPSDPSAADCRFVTYIATTLDTKLYSISPSSPGSAPASFQTISAAQVHQLGISEDGRQLIVAQGELHGVPAAGNLAYTNCGYTFYTIASHAFSPLTPSEFACNWVGTVMASPSRTTASRTH